MPPVNKQIYFVKALVVNGRTLYNIGSWVAILKTFMHHSVYQARCHWWVVTIVGSAFCSKDTVNLPINDSKVILRSFVNTTVMAEPFFGAFPVLSSLCLSASSLSKQRRLHL
jgi:hypothetical protein